MATCNYYPKFEANQVLTADQLNQVVCYLDKQERLTRSKLIGIGIVCGLNLDIIKSPSVAVKVSKGCGITSDGYLIVLNKYTTEKSVSDWHLFTKYRSYKDPSKYSLFGDENSQLALWELLYDDFEDENSTITKLSQKFLEDKAVILFLEKKEVDLATCTGDDCNEKGIRVELNLRVLLISLSDLTNIIKNCYTSSVSPDYKTELTGKFKLPEYLIEREYNLNGKNGFFEYKDLMSLYVKIFEKCSKELPPLLLKTYDIFNPLLSETFAENPFKNLNLIAALKKFLDNNPYGYQYCYDFLKDVASTYNEFRESVFDLTTICCVDSSCFPRHLMLGEAIPSGNCIPSIYRNAFTPSPIHNSQKELRDKTILLFKRLVELIQSFNLPAGQLKQVSITPSKECKNLGERAIPYYYFGKEFEINNAWNYDFVRKCRPYYNLSYYSKLYPKDSTPEFVYDPLKFDLCGYDFFRVEGYLGKDSSAVMESLITTINNNNLPIKILRLRLGKEPTAEDALPNCQFQDLDLIYQTLRVEFLCFLNNELKYFSQLDYGYSETVETKYGSLKVNILDSLTKRGVSGAHIELNSLKSYSETIGGVANTSGTYIVRSIPVGGYTLSVSANGFNNSSQQITIEEDHARTIVIVLERIFRTPIFTKGLTFSAKNESSVSATDTSQPKNIEAEKATDSVVNVAFGSQVQSKIVGYQYSEMSVGNLFKKFLDFSTGDLLGFLGTVGKGKVPTDELINKYYYPLQIVKAINNTISAVAEEMVNFDLTFLSSKTDALLEILNPFADQINKNLKDENYVKTGLESEILVHINELGRMCTIQNFKEVVDIYRQRAIEIQKLTLFNYFIQKHSGVEHKAGAPRGGTFILVCDDNNTAIADFSLPYICCSDCPPINYVLADQPVIFKLSKSTFCADDDSNYVFVNEPAGGVVSGDGVTQDSSTGQFFFNPLKAGVGQIKLNYKFNLHNYELTVEVVKITPNFTFVIDKPQPGSSTRVVSFSGLPDNADSYEWDFGDGSDKTSGQKVTHTFDVSETQDFDVTLVVKQGECTGTVTQKITIPTCTAEFSYTIERIADNIAVVQFDSALKDGDKYDWKFGDGQTFSGEDPLHKFDLSKVNTFKVTLNVAKGDCQDSSEQDITIKSCTAEFSAELLDTTTTQAFYLFTAKTTDADKYNWDFGDGTTSGISSASIKHTYQLGKQEQKIQVKLVMQKDVCTSTQTVDIVLPPAKIVTISLETNEFCKKDEKQYKFNVSVPGGELVGKGVTKQGNDYFFSPISDDVAAGTITFTYKSPDGNSTTYSVVVYNPVAVFEIASISPLSTANQPGYIVLVKNGSQNVEKNVWQLSGVVVSTDANPRIIIPDAKPGAQFQLSLTVSFKNCSDTATQVVKIPNAVIGVIDKINITTAGSSTAVFQPADSGTVVNDQPQIAFNSNLTTVKDLSSNAAFGNALTANVAAYKNTKAYLTSVSEELNNATTKKLYVSGNKNDEMATQFGSVINDTVTRILKYSGSNVKEQRQFAYNLILLQVSQLFNLIGLQKADIASNSSIANLFASLFKQLMILKDNGVDLNPDGQLKDIIDTAMNVSKDKPLLQTYLAKITKAAIG